MQMTSMKVFPVNNTRSYNNKSQIVHPNLAPLPKDTISFGFEKKSQITNPFDRIVVEKSGLDISKIKTANAIRVFCRKTTRDILRIKAGGEKKEVRKQRIKILAEWIHYLKKTNFADIYGDSGILVIIDGITKDLKETNKALPPRLDRDALADTMYYICAYVEANKNSPSSLKNISFRNIYNKKLREAERKRDKANIGVNSFEDGWIVIPSKKSEPAGFKNNVEKLKIFSHDSWCTKSFLAEEHLEDCDIHIYYQNGKPKLAIRFENADIVEIQGVKNNHQIPLDYLNVVKAYVMDNSYSLSKSAKDEVEKADRSKIAVENIIQNKLKGKDPKNCSAEEIFAAIGIEVQQDKEDGLYILSHFGQPDKDFTFEDFGCNIKEINKLLGKTKIIKGDADFAYTTVNDLSCLKKILGNANFQHSQVKKLQKLKFIGGNVNCRDFKIDSMPNLERIGGDANFFESKVQKLPKLEDIGGKADFFESETYNLSNLKTIGGMATFYGSNVRELENLKIIRGIGDFKDSQITELPSLQICPAIIWDGHSIRNYNELVARGIEFIESMTEPSLL